jgi:Ca2+:H+ antiporter
VWSWLAPLAGAGVFALATAMGVTGPVTLIAAVVLVAAIFAAVHHAEVVAHWLGEPFGTLVLAVAVTVIEVALIISVMIAGGPDKASLPRDTAFATVMIICNGVVGLCLLTGGVRHHEQDFRLQGALAALAVLAALVTLTLVLPSYATSSDGPTFTPLQLAFAGVASLVLYGSFIFVQTIRHRDYFLPPGGGSEGEHAAAPGGGIATASLVLLVVTLVVVVGLAKLLTPSIEQLLDTAGAPKGFVGIVIAMLVLTPESLSALRAGPAAICGSSIYP